MHNASLMQVADAYDDLSGVELDDLFGEPLLLQEDFVELSASNERHHKVKSKVVLEKVVHSNKERVIALEHDVLFEDGAINLILLDQNVLSNALYSVQSLVTFHLSKEHLTKSSSTNDHEELEVLECNLLLNSASSGYKDTLTNVLTLIQRQLPLPIVLIGVLLIALHQITEVIGQVVKAI